MVLCNFFILVFNFGYIWRKWFIIFFFFGEVSLRICCLIKFDFRNFFLVILFNNFGGILGSNYVNILLV